ncbi:MAG TPA: enoyl-CoA hydratase [Stellaceae bacterium]|jgi:enoyl-CoA hydratase/carnithine racemase|nr:enoyl-CoA hydratase [Stellaceae bacterium]
MAVEVAREAHKGGGFVARVTIANERRLNSLNRALMGEFLGVMTGLAGDPDLRLAIVTGAGGRAFVGGADVNELATLDRDNAREFITLVHRCCDSCRRLPVPVIARIDGYALGAGLELAAACDLRVASPGSHFGMPEVRIGIPSVVEAALLPRLIGAGRARNLVLTGETIDAPTALAWGLVDAVGDLDTEVERFAAPILESGPNAIRIQKALVLDWEEAPSASAAVERGIDRFVEAFDTDEPHRMAAERLAAMRARKAG